MPVDFQETYSSRNFEVRDVAGALADAGTVKVDITKPDGVAVAQFDATHPSTGIYNFDYLTTQYGWHPVTVTATGGTLGSLSRKWISSFVVEDPARPGFINTDEAIAHLRASGVIVGADDFEQLRWLCIVASDAVEGDLGIAISRRTVTETYNGGQDVLLLRSGPVISITSVTESGTLLASSDYVLNATTGRLYRGTTTSPQCFTWGRQNVSVVYVVGLTNPPRIARKVALNGVERMWQSSQQTAHPLLDDVSASAAIFGGVGTLTPLELAAYNALRPVFCA